MRNSPILLVIGIAQIILSLEVGRFGWLLGWSGLSWILVGAAYRFHTPALFGKRSDGRMAWWSVILLFPYLAVTWLLWVMQTRLTREPRHHEIVSSLWLGRYCSQDELPSGVVRIVDLTSEFPEPKSVTTGRTYLCLPTLDTSAPSLEAFHDLIRTVASSDQPTYIHCALGHGRSAMVVIAVLIARGDAATLDEAIAKVKAIRPGIKINPPQRRLLEQWMSRRLSS